MSNTRRDILNWLCASILLCGLPSGSISAEGAWTKKADLPTPRMGIHANAVEDWLYVIGGDQITATTAPSGLVEVYDPAKDAWMRKADMPTARGFFGTAVVDGKIYAIGGSPNMIEHDRGIAVVEAYDPTTDTWTRKADMPTPRGGSYSQRSERQDLRHWRHEACRGRCTPDRRGVRPCHGYLDAQGRHADTAAASHQRRGRW